MEYWYAFYTKPKAEYQVATTLERHLIPTYLPEIKVSGNQQQSQKKPFFDCYLFARVDFKKTRLSQIIWTPGLRRIISFGGQPTPLADEVIDFIRTKLAEVNAGGGWQKPAFKPGETVRITSGPFQDMLAIFEGPTTPAKRVHVLLNILGHANRTQLDVADLEKASVQGERPAPKRPRRSRGKGRPIKGIASA